jgi:hypothetical protein
MAPASARSSITKEASPVPIGAWRFSTIPFTHTDGGRARGI